MTDDDNILQKLTGESTRRSVLKSGALATAGAGLAAGSVTGAAAQEDGGGGEFDEDNLFNEQQAQKGLIFRRVFKPNVPFTVVSDVVDFQPDVQEVEDNIWSGYNTRIIRYLDNDEHILFFPANDAEMGPFDSGLGFTPDDEFFQDGAFEDNTLDENELTQNAVGLPDVRPQLFVMDINTGFFGDSEEIVTVQFSEVREEEEENVFGEFGNPDFNPVGGNGE